MKIRLTKMSGELLKPSDEESAEFVRKLKSGQVIHADFKKMHNYEFFKKWWGLVTFAYEHWEPGELQDSRFEGVVPEKSFEGFRKDITILAGYYNAYYRIDGSSRIEAKSISFARMEADEFEKLYSNTVDAVLKHILTNYNEEELERVLIEVMSFT